MQDNKLPKWIQSYLTSSEVENIEESLAEAEATTMGEIVPVIVRRSSPIEYIPVLLFLFFATIRGMAFHSYFHENLWIALAYEFGFIVLAWFVAVFLSRFETVQRFFVRMISVYDFPFQRAKLAFYEKDIYKTKDRTGILLFISLMERRVIVLGDKAIKERVDEGVWTSLVDHLARAASQKKLSSGFITVIKLCGDILSQHFPIKHGDINELPDKLIIRE